MWEESYKVKNIIINGKGRAFCAGGDVKDVIEMVKDPSKHERLAHQIDTEYNMIHFMGTMKTPYIAIMDGITMGAGGGIVCPAPFRIATENTQFAMPETSIGLFCDVGASFFLSRLDGYLGTYMGLTSRVVKAEDALFAGIATHFVPSERLEALEAQLAKLDNKYDHEAVHRTIEAFAVNKDHVPETYTLHGEHQHIINQCFKYETVEEIIRALKENGSKFAIDTIDTILKRSPTSVKVTLEHLCRGSKLSWMNCLRMELQLWQTVPFAHDFVEGVTSHVIHKRAPKWNPPRLEDLDLEEDIRIKFFYANTKRRLFFSNQEDYDLHPYRRFALPSEKEILQTKDLQNLKTVQETVEWFEKDRNGKFGVKQKVEDVLNRAVN
ncbi:ClpP/crotonase-like domain-containing protein [Cokeromyces recurvatus]|uniref:ClpP/crotonase-like domain-containing protein n=1 Tax=Cokeromyces recurvatus TaxID=90255 RepID=UPI0022202231|nr:ClpP/crotonase-like domain-containing protein [Cokeromyces recurvatus]KAI7906626.1 ClpP/crotonase-like domain-containing protein [Cokeromyces recurvatus]